MSAAGLSKPRLERMHQVLSGHIERKDMPGLVALVSHNRDVHVETLGTLAFGNPAPMERDTIFRIALHHEDCHGGCGDDSGRRM